MQARDMVCIVCPGGCRLKVSMEDGEVKVTGNQCNRGKAYAKQEFLCPMRTVTSSVLVKNGKHPLCAVKTAGQVPKANIPEVLEVIRDLRPEAPVHRGQVLCANIAGTGADLIATGEA
jgi:CxxC motif-containing protein